MATDTQISKTAQNVVQITLNGQIAGGRATSSIFYMQADRLPSGDQCSRVADQIHLSWSGNVLSGQCNTFSLKGTNWILLTTPDSGTGMGTNTGGTGGATTAAAPPQVALLATKVAQLSTRKGRAGRTYVVALEENQVDAAGNISAPNLAGWQTKLNAFAEAIAEWTDTATGGIVWHHVTPHWFKDNKPADEVGGPWPAASVSRVVDMIPQSVVATQRRRLNR